MSGALSVHGSAVELGGVTKRYGRVEAVREISLGVAAGRFTTLLGPSGSGKTTTLHVIAGFVEPTSGTIHIDGKSMAGVPPHHRDLGVVFQNYALFPHLTVERNIAFPLEMRRVDRREMRSRVAEALDLVSLAGYERRLPAQLSGGQQQRVALARALVYRPKVLLMDEPLGALDKNLRHQMQFELKRIQSELGVTVISVTHDQLEALTLSDEIVVFNGGRIEQRGRPREIYDRPSTPFVATFLGEANLLSGRLSSIDGGVARVSTAAGLELRAAHDGLIETGSDVQVVIRPEAIRLTDSPGIGCRVSQVTFGGESVRVEAVAPAGSRFVVLQRAHAAVPSVGDEVWLHWEAAHASLIRVGPSDAVE